MSDLVKLFPFLVIVFLIVSFVITVFILIVRLKKMSLEQKNIMRNDLFENLISEQREAVKTISADLAGLKEKVNSIEKMLKEVE